MTQQLHDNRITALYCRLSRDDGYSGTNFNRPDFSRMIEMVEHNTISTVVVKGLSRLEREYFQTGYYSEIFFPMHDVRFIAINDGVDTATCENEFAPFKNLSNVTYIGHLYFGMMAHRSFKDKKKVMSDKKSFVERLIRDADNELERANAKTRKELDKITARVEEINILTRSRTKTVFSGRKLKICIPSSQITTIKSFQG